MHKQTSRRLHAGFDSEPLHTGLYNPRRGPTPEEFTADKNVEVGSLRLDFLLVQLPPPPQHDLSLRQSPAAGTGLDEPGVPHTVTQQTEQEGTFLFKPVSMAFCVLTVQGSRKIHHLKHTPGQIPKQLQYKSPLTRSLRNCRGAGNSEGSHRRSKQGICPGRVIDDPLLSASRRLFRALYALYFFYFSVHNFSFIKQVREARRIFRQGWDRLGYARHMDE